MSDKSIEAAARALCESEGYFFWPDDNPPDGHYGKLARACVEAYLAAEREAGRVMVPVEPCENMRGAGADELVGSVDDDWGEDAAKVYRAMIAAAPVTGTWIVDWGEKRVDPRYAAAQAGER